MNADIVTRAYICVYNKPDDSKSMHICIYPYIHTVQSTNYVHIDACINLYILSYNFLQRLSILQMNGFSTGLLIETSIVMTPSALLTDYLAALSGTHLQQKEKGDDGHGEVQCQQHSA